MRGFACIALDSPKTPENIGGVLRACHNYRVAQINIASCRAKDLDFPTNTPKAHRHTPTFIVADPLAYIPHDTSIVAVDLVDGAKPLPSFNHPQRAMYVFGAEDGTLGHKILERCHHRVFVPTRDCMNLSTAVSVVLYDRMAKGQEFGAAFQKLLSREYRKESQ